MPAASLLHAQTAADTQARIAYIAQYKDAAIEEMRLYRIPASITLAQGCLESNNGNSRLAREARNHFGIKCHKEWTGPGYTMDDDTRNECFRVYKTVMDSYRDHSLFLTSRPWYFPLFDLDIRDYKGWAHGLKKAGYATLPSYGDALIKIIEDFGLYEYDNPEYTGNESLAMEIKKPVVEGKPAGDEDFAMVSLESSVRDIDYHNRIRYTIARKDDSAPAIAAATGTLEWQIYRYNELPRGAPIPEGSIVYLQPKRGKGSSRFHTAANGQTMYEISQKYGIKMKSLYSKNRMEPGTQPVPGQKLWLRSVKPSDSTVPGL